MSTSEYADESESYIVNEIFPILMPALEAMMYAAANEKCFKKKFTKFRPLDFLTEYLYNNNPQVRRRTFIKFEDIDFVQEHLKYHPRLPVPKFLTWTDEEAAIIIQSYFRGYLTRRQPEVQELREYQKEMKLKTITYNRASRNRRFI